MGQLQTGHPPDNEVNKICSSVVDLTDDAWLLVFAYLGTADRIRIGSVCTRWRELARISWKNITRLSFENVFKPPSEGGSFCHQLTDDRLEVFLRQCGTPRLRCLDLYSTWNLYLTSRALDLVGLYGTSLQELNLSCIRLDKTSLKTLAERLPRLQSLTLAMVRYGSTLDEDGLRCVLKMLQSLKSLNVSGNKWITGEFFSQAPQSLTEVNAMDCQRLSDKGVRLLAERCPNLEAIDIRSSYTITGQSITDLTENCRKLKRFKFNGSCTPWPENLFMSHITLRKLPLLEELHMDYHTAVTDQVFYELGRHCPLLRSISCEGCQAVTDTAISHLSPCRHLESINLSFCDYITDNALIQLSSAHFELKEVYLKGCEGVTDEGVGHLFSAHPNMLRLSVDYCPRVTDRLLPVLELGLQRRQHTQPLEICLEHTSISEENALVFIEGRSDVKPFNFLADCEDFAVSYLIIINVLTIIILLLFLIAILFVVYFAARPNRLVVL